MNSLMPDCTSKCRSLQHALDVISVVTRGSEGQIKAFLSSYCYNAATIKDAFGRNVLHLASSCGKKGVLDWLAETKGVDLSAKDKESGWTALHRSIFYGYIDCVLSLLKHGVSLYVQDKEGLSALDLVMKDRPIHVVFKKTDPTEVYTWGNNINFTLGHGGQQSKHHPELVDLFPRNSVYIKQPWSNPEVGCTKMYLLTHYHRPWRCKCIYRLENRSFDLSIAAETREGVEEIKFEDMHDE